MFFGKCFSLFGILDESPFFSQLSILERERLIKDLLQSYPELTQSTCSDMEVGYEASWLMKRSH